VCTPDVADAGGAQLVAAARSLRFDRIREALAATAGRPTDRIEMRVAASVAHLGLTARILAPLLALTSPPASSRPSPWTNLYWQDDLGGAYTRSISGPKSQRRRSARYIQDGADPGVVGPVAAEPRFSSLGASIVRCCHMAG
jgi:hypothetical protein